MNTEPMDVDLKPLMALRFVVFALAMGVLTFIGVVLYLKFMGQVQMAPGSEMVSYLGFAMLAGVLGLHPVILKAIDAIQRKQIKPGGNELQSLLQGFQMRTIFGCALIEGAAFMCILGSLLSGEPWGLIAGGLGAAVMIGFHFPTVGRFAAYVEKQRAASGY